MNTKLSIYQFTIKWNLRFTQCHESYMVQTDIKASTALRYDTGGNDACDLACCVERVRRDVTPSVTLAGAASGFIQNDTH